ncbi:hypothetical protein REPUB_Repub07fG0079300 [Reevesia pubescens]
MRTEEKSEYKKRLWTVEEDRILTVYIRLHGKGKWNRIPKVTGLKRCGKSCRLRWINYLSPTVKRGGFSEKENDLIIRLHNLLGNRELKQSDNTIPLDIVLQSQDCNDDGGGVSQKMMTRSKEISQNTDDFTVAQGLITLSDDYESSPWFFHNDLKLHTPNVMELLDEPLDFVWHGL